MEFPALRSICLAFLLTSCAPFTTSDPITDALKNSGPVPLDPNNPYVASNIYIKEQVKKSAELSGFLKLKGYPSSIEVKTSTFGGETLSLLYEEQRERYDVTKPGAAWIITGPFRNGDTVASQPPPISIPVKTPANKLTDKKPVATPPAVFYPEKTPIPVLSSLPEEPEAEISPRGDLVHYVTMPGETLSIIARWYTNERDNAGKLSRLNKLKNSDALSIGDTIVIPSYMIKNKKRLTESALSNLKTIAGDEKSKADQTSSGK